MAARHVFISYDRETRLQASELASALRRRGFEAWLDENLDPGMPFRQQIEQAADNAQWIVFLIGPKGQPGNFGESERMAALKSVWADSSKGVLPILFGTNALPPFLQGWQALIGGKTQGAETWIDRAIEIINNADADSRRAGQKQLDQSRKKREQRYAEITRAVSALREKDLAPSLQASLAE